MGFFKKKEIVKEKIKLNYQLVIRKDGKPDEDFNSFIFSVLENLIRFELIPQDYAKYLIQHKADFTEKVEDPILPGFTIPIMLFKIPLTEFIVTDEQKIRYNNLKHIIQEDIKKTKKYKNYQIYNKISYWVDSNKDFIRHPTPGIFVGTGNENQEINIDNILNSFKEIEGNINEENLYVNFCLTFNIFGFETPGIMKSKSQLINLLIREENEEITKKILYDYLKSSIKEKDIHKFLDGIKPEKFDLESNFEKARNILYKDIKKTNEEKKLKLNDKDIKEMVDQMHYLQFSFIWGSIPLKLFNKLNRYMFNEFVNYMPDSKVFMQMEITSEKLPRARYDWKIKLKEVAE